MVHRVLKVQGTGTCEIPYRSLTRNPETLEVFRLGKGGVIVKYLRTSFTDVFSCPKEKQPSSSEMNQASTMDFDGALNKSGGFGRFQKILALVFLTTATAHFTSNHMSQVFLLIVPEHYWCPAVVSEGNSSFAEPGYSGNDSLVVVKQSCLLERGFGATDTNGTAAERCPGGWQYEYGDLYPTMSTEVSDAPFKSPFYMRRGENNKRRQNISPSTCPSLMFIAGT